jgi:hypothetical protein
VQREACAGVGGWHSGVGETHGENGVALTLLGKGRCLLTVPRYDGLFAQSGRFIQIRKPSNNDSRP